MFGLYVLAAVFEVVGLCVAVPGFVKTWRQHGPGTDFWAREKNLAKVAWARVRRVFRRPRVAPARGGFSVEATATVTWRGFAPFDPLPDPTRGLGPFTREVENRINRLHRMIDHGQHRLAEDVEASGRTVREELVPGVEAAQQTARQVAIGGLKLQTYGWMSLLVGIILGSIANVLDAY